MRATILSYRNLDRHPGRCYDFEFEDLAAALLGAGLVAPQPAETGGLRRRRKGFAPVRLGGPQDLVLVNCMSVWDLGMLAAVPDWREQGRVAVCWIKELFACTEIPADLLALLGRMDLVVLNFQGSVEALRSRLRGPEVIHLPLGIDALRFAPHPVAPARGIDLFWIGRSDPAIHVELLAMAEREGLYYHFNSVFADAVTNHCEHRSLLSSMLKRTRLFVVQPAKFNDPAATGGQEEIGYRYLEGASAGATLIGHAPAGGAIAELLPWADAVLELPARGFAAAALELLRRDDDPRPRARSVAHCLRNHDWVYRLETLLDRVGLPVPGEGVAARRARLAATAEAVLEATA